MSKVIDNICKIRDILEYKDYKKFGHLRQLCKNIFDDVHKHIRRKTEDYSYELDFTSQDLRETAQAINDTFKRWDNIMSAEKNIKKLIKCIDKGKLDLNPFTNDTIPIMSLRRDYTQPLTELRSLLEYHSVFLYFLEEASDDKIALKCTQRLK